MIKGWYTKHKETGTWHKIKDVTDTGVSADKEGGGNVVHLEGHKDPVHTSKLEGMEPKPPVEKYDRVDIEADGTRELEYGKEDLEKRWEGLKKALNADEAFLNIASAEGIDEQEDGDEEEVAEQQLEEEGADESIEPEEDVDEAADSSENNMEEPGESFQEDEDSLGEEEIEPETEAEEALIQALLDDGHTEEEINYIMHGHAPHSPDVDDNKADNERMSGIQQLKQDKANHEMDSSHKQRMNDLEYQKAASEIADPEAEKSHRQRMMDTEYEGAQKDINANKMDLEHKQKMLDLEYEKAKKEMEMELKFKEKEHELKLKQSEENAKHKAEAAKQKHVQKLADQKKDANVTSKKEKEGKE